MPLPLGWGFTSLPHLGMLASFLIHTVPHSPLNILDLEMWNEMDLEIDIVKRKGL